MSLLRLKNISLSYKKRRILDDVSLDLQKGDFVTIIGPNGAGKTSLLKIILGILKAENGAVERGDDLRIGYVAQNLKIDEVMPIKVADFLKLCEKSDNFDEIVRKTGISGLLGEFLYSLSGGERQKVLLAKALMTRPNLLILDEPTQNLDISGQIAFYKLLDEIYKSEKIAILMVSHDLHMVMKSSQKVICLYNHICCQGRPEEVSLDPKFLAIFGSEMKELLAIYNHFHNHKHD